MCLKAAIVLGLGPVLRPGLGLKMTSTCHLCDKRLVRPHHTLSLHTYLLMFTACELWEPKTDGFTSTSHLSSVSVPFVFSCWLFLFLNFLLVRCHFSLRVVSAESIIAETVCLCHLGLGSAFDWILNWCRDGEYCLSSAMSDGSERERTHRLNMLQSNAA